MRNKHNPWPFKRLLRHNRQRQRLTQQALADISGYSRANYGKWELGCRPPTKKTCDVLAAVLEINPDTLWETAVWERLSDDEYRVIAKSLTPDRHDEMQQRVMVSTIQRQQAEVIRQALATIQLVSEDTPWQVPPDIIQTLEALSGQ